LGPDAALVSYLCYDRYADPAAPGAASPPPTRCLLAFVLRPDGELRRVDLGAAVDAEELVRAWRAALGRPVESRGVGGSAASARGDDAERLGMRLRATVLDPVLAAAGSVRTLHVVLDDFLHLVPLDSLPLEVGLVGDRYAVRIEVSCARLVRHAPAPSGAA